jgi:HD-like signal output (HDOD) protein
MLSLRLSNDWLIDAVYAVTRYAHVNLAATHKGFSMIPEVDTDKTRTIGFDFVKELSGKLSTGKLELPPFPDIAVRVQNAVNDPNVDVKKLAQIVVSEPILTTRILRMANSALLNRGSVEVTDLQTAISRVGLDMVRNASVSLATESCFTTQSNSKLHERLKTLRTHSMEVAALSYLLAKRFCRTCKPDEAMLAGLLHEIGKFYILTRLDAYPELFSDDDLLRNLTEQWYTGIGYAIVEFWGFGETITQAVDEHNDLYREHSGPVDLADVVQVAYLLSKSVDPTQEPVPDLDDVPSFRLMKLDADSRVSVIQESAEMVSSFSQALSH